MNYPVIDLDIDTLSGMKPLRRVVFSLGGNQGEVLETLQQAVDAIASTPDVIVTDVSSVYRTAPVGKTDQPDFLNIVVLAETMMSSSILLERVQAIEYYLGRVREERWGPRTIDIDLIQLGDRRRTDEHLTLPHPRAHERAFVLVPWLEADPGAELSGVGPVADLLADVDPSGVERVEGATIHLP
ncbi:2-amino-4-hydroxy-6-hydroxymethyldihydropteridine diphosphokinase [Propioniciclava sinopodophylli]|nr:2-amino-4-hydroxy-6-hydroxymethyldihydropteridine diphosphokinase [Propioniciclava sinopodophylli]